MFCGVAMQSTWMNCEAGLLCKVVNDEAQTPEFDAMSHHFSPSSLSREL